jgi:hypothetical protein
MRHNVQIPVVMIFRGVLLFRLKKKQGGVSQPSSPPPMESAEGGGIAPSY